MVETSFHKFTKWQGSNSSLGALWFLLALLKLKVFSFPFCSPLGVPSPLHGGNAFSPLSLFSAAFQTQKIFYLQKILPPHHFPAVSKASETAAFLPPLSASTCSNRNSTTVRPLFCQPFPSPCPWAIPWETFPSGSGTAESGRHQLLLDFISENTL